MKIAIIAILLGGCACASYHREIAQQPFRGECHIVESLGATYTPTTYVRIVR